MVTPAEQLLLRLRPHNQKRKLPADKCVNDFLEHLEELRSKHISKTYQKPFLFEHCFEVRPSLKTSVYRMNCKVQLLVAIEQLEKLVEKMKAKNGKVTSAALTRHSSILSDYLFDLRPIAMFLEAKNPNYRYFNGWKSYSTHTSMFFRFSVDLAQQSARFRPVKYPHNIASMTSIFVLRQALEARFHRIIGLYFLNRNGTAPRLNGSFHYDFIEENLDLFRFRNFEWSLLRPVYNWCSSIVHSATQPFAWQVQLAHETCAPLFLAPPFSTGGWNISGSVKILDANELRNRFAKRFWKKVGEGEGIWCMLESQPEAVID